MTIQSACHCYDFSYFRLDESERLLFRNHEVVHLPPKVFELLLLLVQNHGHVLTKDELLNALWPGSFIEEGNVPRNISTLRHLLGLPECIETVPRRGYRFCVPVRELWQEPGEENALWSKDVVVIHSLAVLPFQPLSAAECDDSLGLRLADALITQFSNYEELAVRPTSTVRRYVHFELDPVAVGRELRVDAVLAGSLQQADGRIRVTAQLHSMVNGSSLWGEHFDAPFSDLFTLEDSLSTQVVQSLATLLRTTERRASLVL